MESRNSFLFVRNFKMNLKDSGNLDLAAKDQYICMLIRGEALRHFDLLSSDMDSTNPLTAEATILGLVTYFFPVNFLPNQQCSMWLRMRKSCGLNVRRCAVRLIDLNEHLDLLPVEKLTEELVWWI